jgi:Uma2 family endonuclease
MATAQSSSGHILLENVTWETYERLLREAGERHIRMTYDDGDLEIMTLSFGHENIGEIIGALIRAFALVLKLPLRSGGSTTLRKKLKRKGLEPDKCFWIKNEKAMRGKTKWHASKDPPPDLAVEVDVTHSSLDRMGIYAALRVAEVWRYRAKKLRVHVLGQDGANHEAPTSSVFPHLDIGKVNEFVHAAATLDETTLVANFTAWVRQEVLPLVETGLPRNGRNPGKTS